MAVKARSVAFTSAGVAGSADTGLGQLVGFSFGETAGAAASVNLRKASGTGDIIAVIKLAANESVNIDYNIPRDGTSDNSGDPVASQTIFIEDVSGTWTGAVHGL